VKYKLSNLIDTENSQKLLESFCDVVGIAAAIIDLDGEVLVGSRWQRICTDFHRVNEETCQKCIESDTQLANALQRGKPFSIYKCQNGLTDAASPIIIEGEHVANAFVGQFFVEKPNRDSFIERAASYGFEETEYLDALSQVPVVMEENLAPILNFLTTFAEMIAIMGIDRFKQIKAAEALLESEKKFSKLFQSAPVYIAFTALDDGVFLEVNDAFTKITGYERSETIGRTPFEIGIWPEPAERPKFIQMAQQHGGFHEEEVKLSKKNGEPLFGLWSAERIELLGKSCLISVLIDITERKRAEEALRESEEKFRDLFDNAPLGYLEYDREGRITRVNQTNLDMLGYKREELLGESIWELYVEKEEACEQILAKLAGRLPPGRGFVRTYRRKDETILPVLVEDRLLRDDREHISGIRSTFQDIMERKKAEEALKASQQRLSQIIDFLPDATMVIDLDGKVIAWNRAIEEMTGVRAEDILGKGDYEYAIPFYGEKRPVLIDLVSKWDKEIEKKYRYVKKEGESLVSETFDPIVKPGGFLWNKASLLYDRDGNEIGVIESIRDITEMKVAEEAQKQAEKALRESQEKYRNLVEESFDGILIQRGPNIIFTNKRLNEMLGYEAGELIGQKHWLLYHPDYQKFAIERAQARMRQKKVENRYEVKLQRKDGSCFLGEINARTITFSSGEESEIQVWVKDIDERKRAGKLLQKEKENLSVTLDYNPHGIVLIHKNGKWISVNPRFTEITGYLAEDVTTGREWFQKAYPDAAYRKTVINVWKKDSEQLGRSNVREFDITCKDGQVKQIEISTAHLANRSVSVLTDITQRRKIEGSLHEAKLILDNLSDIAYRADCEGNVIYANPAAERITGIPLNEIIGQPFFPLFVEEDQRSLKEVYERTLAGECLESTLKFNSGITCHFTSLPFKDHHGNIIGTFGIARDISDRLDAEKAIKESEARLKKAQSVAKIGSWEYDISTGKVWGSLQAFRIYGIERTSPYLPLERVEACIPDALKVNQALIDLIEKNKPYDIEFEVNQEITGQTIIIHSLAELVYVEGKPVKVLGIIHDVTAQKKEERERKDLENQLQRAQKMEALGLLAGGVAHDLNNILSGIVSYPELLLMDLPEGSPLIKPIKTIQESGIRAAEVVSDLLTLARGVSTGKEISNFNTLLKEYLNSAEHNKLTATHPSVIFRAEIDSDLLNISCSPTHIKKSLMNLVINASEAIEGSGIVTISATNRYLDEPLRGYEDVRTGEYVMLSVSDSGLGIPHEDLERIFEPFYTRKTLGRSGTGLGLVVVWNTVRDHGGYINVKSSERGTIFELYFPVTREEATTLKDHISLEDYLGQGEEILVVDDEERQRVIACGILMRLGYGADAVSSGEEAIQYVKKHHLDLIVLDMIMPNGINGLETYEAVLKIRPGQKVIIASGYSRTKEVQIAQDLGAGEYIKKPYTLEKIAVAVKEELEK
jgi:PAS domain S-box-containing protein